MHALVIGKKQYGGGAQQSRQVNRSRCAGAGIRVARRPGTCLVFRVGSDQIFSCPAFPAFVRLIVCETSWLHGETNLNRATFIIIGIR